MWNKFLNWLKENSNKVIETKTKVKKPKNVKPKKQPVRSKPSSVEPPLSDTVNLQVPKPIKNLSREQKLARLQEIQQQQRSLEQEKQDILDSLRGDDVVESSFDIYNQIVNSWKEKIKYENWINNMKNWINYLNSDIRGQTFLENFKDIETIWDLLLQKIDFEKLSNELNDNIQKWRNNGFINKNLDNFKNQQINKLNAEFLGNEKVNMFWNAILNNQFANAIILLKNIGIIDDTEYNYEV